jgi:hypothetical protein
MYTSLMNAQGLYEYILVSMVGFLFYSLLMVIVSLLDKKEAKKLMH